jgi:hypothetical protein
LQNSSKNRNRKIKEKKWEGGLPGTGPRGPAHLTCSLTSLSSPPQPAPALAVYRLPRRRGAVGPDKNDAPCSSPGRPRTLLFLPLTRARSPLFSLPTNAAAARLHSGSYRASLAAPTSSSASPSSTPSSPATHLRRRPRHCGNRAGPRFGIIGELRRPRPPCAPKLPPDPRASTR